MTQPLSASAHPPQYFLTSPLREFDYKAFHRILITNKELKLFKIRDNDICVQCKNPDSIEHTFLESPMNVQRYQESYRGSILWVTLT